MFDYIAFMVRFNDSSTKAGFCGTKAEFGLGQQKRWLREGAFALLQASVLLVFFICWGFPLRTETSRLRNCMHTLREDRPGYGIRWEVHSRVRLRMLLLWQCRVL